MFSYDFRKHFYVTLSSPGHIFRRAGLPTLAPLLAAVTLIAFNLFAETISRAPTSVRGYPSFVKKIIFPVNILPVVPLGAALVHAGFNFLILLVALGLTGHLHAGIMLFPLLVTPLLLLALGLSWFLAAWGVFLKDMTQIVPVFVQMLLFLSPVFYPVSAVRYCAHLSQPLNMEYQCCPSPLTGRMEHSHFFLVNFGLCPSIGDVADAL